ncbi:alpha/beta hydrolase family protein [Paenibacillus chungangensis]|uniref:Alpha/beta hydrolase family protein n=1 Tax=Paenibacillus chungangensis TaxID=696535 RepID=A0ABW3HMF6_9BACL
MWRRLGNWLSRRFKLRLARDGRLSMAAASSLALFGAIAIAASVPGMPTGLGLWTDMLFMLLLHSIVMWAVCYGITFLFSLLYLPLPRRLAAIYLYVVLEAYIILYYMEWGILLSLSFAIAYASLALLAGLLSAAAMRSGRSRMMRWGAVSAAAVLLGTSSAALVAWSPSDAAPPRVQGVEDVADEVSTASTASIIPIAAEDPSATGEHEIISLSYGSGRDKHRKRFGSEVDKIAAPVDASSIITKWPKKKEWFWGFDQHELPINGTVWMPKENGKFPLVFIVHGNHLMEHFSDEGYAYLGELLASRGMIVTSVDANFLNYSVWSGIPNDDMKARAWLMLQHLRQFLQWDQSDNDVFAGKIDWNNIAMIGHSRGGQAVAMAADRESWFADDSSLKLLEGVSIKSVVAIAPTDKRVDSKSASLSNVNYLTIQGARDADVNHFYGSRQYNRTAFDETGYFKSSLYIEDANHSRFNSDWGSMDEKWPGGLMLNDRNMLSGEEQRHIAKVYISAFLESTLLANQSYMPLFQDYRTGMAWLPDTGYVNRYEGAEFVAIERFEGTDTCIDHASATGMASWMSQAAVNRNGASKGTNGVELGWSEAGAEYTFRLTSEAERQLVSLEGGSLMFSLMNMEYDLVSGRPGEDGDQALDEKEQGKCYPPLPELLPQLPPLPEVEIVLIMRNGEEYAVRLQNLAPVQPPYYTAFMRLSWLDDIVKDEKYERPAEAVFQTFVLPLALFAAEDGNAPGQLAPSSIQEITFRFHSGPGKVMLDDIGFQPQGGTYVHYSET